jgi:hypothetical protein
MKSYRQQLHEGSPSGIIEDAVAELNQLGEELQEWADSMPDNLQGSDKHNTLIEGADTLTNLQCDIEDFPHDESTLKYFSHQPKRKSRSPSRAVRLENANEAIQAVIEFYRGLDDEESQDVAGQLEELIMEVEIPSQYG